jgi:hypothetical protein
MPAAGSFPDRLARRPGPESQYDRRVIRSSRTDGRGLTVAGVDWSPRAASARYEVAAGAQRVAIAASEELGHGLDALLALGLLPAMKLGLPLQIPGEVSPRLLDGTKRIQGIFRLWLSDLRLVSVEAGLRREGARADGGVAAFFRGGVDSFYTLLSHREQITDLIFVHGFDIPLSGQEELRRRASEMAHEVAAALDKRLVEVEADIRSFSDRHIPWSHYYGSALAAIGLLFQHRFRSVLIPANQSYAALYPMGSHPLVDPLWSTERMEVVNDGADARRTEKVAFIAQSELAMRWLRVCWENRDGAYNCGRCESACVRSSTFELRTRRGDVARSRITSTSAPCVDCHSAKSHSASPRWRAWMRWK